MKIKINYLAFVLIVAGVAALVYRVKIFNYSIIPQSSAKFWQVEVVEKDYGQTSTKKRKLKLLLPNRETNPKITTENIELPEAGISIVEEGGRRTLTWQKTDNGKDKKFHYTMEAKSGLVGIELNLQEKFTEYIDENFTKKQLSSLKAIAQHKDFKRMPTLKLSECLRKDFCQQLHGNSIKPLKELNLSAAYAYLLKQKGYQVNVALGFRADKAQSQVDFYSWVRANIKNKKYNFYIDRSQNINSGDELLFWNYLPGASFKLDSKQFNFSILPLSSDIAPAQSRQQYTDWFHTIFSLSSLPLGVQIVYQYMLLIPIGSLLVCIFRLVIGIRTLGTFMPVLLAFALGQVGYSVGFFMLLLIIVAGIFFRTLLNYIALLSVARISANLIFVVLLIVIVSKIAWHNDYIFGFSASLFPIIVLAMMIERMSILISEVGIKVTLKTLLATLFLTIGIKEVFALPLVQYWSFYFLETHLITLGLIILVGRYTGYRLTELLRFKDLIKRAE